MSDAEDAANAKERLRAGVAQVQVDGALSRFDTPLQMRKVLNELKQQDPTAHAAGTVRYRVSRIKLG